MNDPLFPFIRSLGITSGLIISLSICNSCGSKSSNSSLPLVATNGGGSVSKNSSAANTLLTQARAFHNEGNARKALSTYKKVIKNYPKSYSAGEAHFAMAQILDHQGDLFLAFEAYQKLISKHHASPHYTASLKRQEVVAHAAADGLLKNKFLGMKTRINPDKVEKMLTLIRANAPQAPSAAKAQYTIGRIWQKEGYGNKSLAAYQEVERNYGSSVYAPESLFQTGEILVLKGEKGNQNKANVNRARDIYNELLALYPSHKRAADARQRLSLLGAQDIQRSYDIAEFYQAKGQKKSAIYYYREVILKSKNRQLANKAQQRINELEAR